MRGFEFRQRLTGKGCHRMARRLSRLVREDRAAQIVEFAVSLPLLIVFVVGIFDFSGAYTLKNKLSNVARESARVAAADPANDLSNTTAPLSVSDAFHLVKNYFAANTLNDCGIASTSGTKSGLTWTFSATGNGCPSGGLTIVINRGYIFPESGAQAPTTCTSQAVGTGTAVVATCVSIQYAYKWQFNRVIGIMVPGSTYAGITNLTALAVAFNEN